MLYETMDIIFIQHYIIKQECEKFGKGLPDRTLEFGHIPRNLILQTPYLIPEKFIITTPTYKELT